MSSQRCLFYTFIEKAEIFHAVHDKFALLMRRRSEHGTRDYDQRLFKKDFKSDLHETLIKEIKLMKLR